MDNVIGEIKEFRVNEYYRRWLIYSLGNTVFDINTHKSLLHNHNVIGWLYTYPVIFDHHSNFECISEDKVFKKDENINKFKFLQEEMK